MKRRKAADPARGLVRVYCLAVAPEWWGVDVKCAGLWVTSNCHGSEAEALFYASTVRKGIREVARDRQKKRPRP